jgi:uncharacterized protein YjbI with pentapeptide repeats
LKEAIVDAPPPDFFGFLFWFEEAMTGSSTPDFLDWAFWFKDSTSVRDLLVSLAAVIGLPLLIWREITGHRTVDIAAKRHEKQTEADREGRITDSFTKAVELLGKPEREVRLGAIYALERIAHDSERDHWPIMETLTAYVRTKAPVQGASQSNQSYSSAASAYAMVVAEGTIEAAQSKVQESSKIIEVDIQAVLVVLSRRNLLHEDNEYFNNKEQEEKRSLVWQIIWQILWGNWSSILGIIRQKLGFQVRGRGGPKQYINLSKANLSWADMIETILIGANLSGANLREASLSRADLRRVDLREASLGRADLREADLRGANLGWADLRGADLRGADLRGASLMEADLRGAYLSSAGLREAFLGRADLRGAYLSEADLRGATLMEADLRGADLSEADLRGAYLSSADLRGADLTRANLRGANLREADLSEADLSEADLSRADLSRAGLYGTDLTRANLREATDANLEYAKRCQTIMPDSTVNSRDCLPEETPVSPNETPSALN